MAALRSDPAAALLLVPDAAPDAPQYMAAVVERVQAALSGEVSCCGGCRLHGRSLDETSTGACIQGQIGVLMLAALRQ